MLGTGVVRRWFDSSLSAPIKVLEDKMDLKEAINVVLNNLCVNDGDCFFDCDTCQDAQKILKDYIDSEETPFPVNSEN